MRALDHVHKANSRRWKGNPRQYQIAAQKLWDEFATPLRPEYREAS